jgi:acyl-CoA dehydrogenase
MSILLDEGQQAIATESRRIIDAREDKSKALALIEADGAYDTAWWDMCREQGWTAVALPEDVGGLGLGLVELGQVALAVGAGIAGAPFLTSSFGAADAINRHGSAESKDLWLARLASGESIGAVAFAEGQSPLPVRPGVSFANGKLTGTKVAVSGGLHANVAVVFAMDGTNPVLVIADLANVERQRVPSFDNSRGAANLVFDDTPATLLDSDDARGAAMAVLARQAIITAHEQVGGAEKAMLIARDYANTRKAFGQLIGAFQAVKHRIAELYGFVEIARANALHAAANAEGPDLIKNAAAARIAATDAYDTSARDSMQLHGGIGVTWETGLHLHQRRTRTLALEQGNLLFWEDVLVNELTGEKA